MDSAAFTELYTEIHIDLYKFALYTLKQPQDAEDAVGEAVVSAFTNIHKLRKEESFKAWMFAILKNQCMKRFREQKEVVPLDQELPSQERDYAEDQDVRKAFSALDEEERMIVSFSVFAGFQSDEIGSMMQMNPATVRSKKKRAFEKMRQRLVE